MKTNIIKFSPSHFLHSQLITELNDTTVSEVPKTKFLGVQIDNHLNWRCHIDHILPKLSTAGLRTKSGNLTNGILCLLSFIRQIRNHILGQ